MERTFIIIKPDAVKQRYTGNILTRIEKEGFTICALRMQQLTKKEAEDFYAVHKARPFYNSLVTFMTEGPVVLATLAAPNAVGKWRKLIGATDPAEADPNTIRKLYAKSKERNAVHGSDSEETAIQEISFFFSEKELLN